MPQVIIDLKEYNELLKIKENTNWVGRTFIDADPRVVTTIESSIVDGIAIFYEEDRKTSVVGVLHTTSPTKSLLDNFNIILTRKKKND